MENATGLSGQTIGKYRIVEHLGRGGMAEVYKAYQPNLDRYVALKLMHAFLAADQDFIARFEREAKNVAALHHPNIVQVYDFDVQNGTPYMVMEYVEGGTLKSHLEDLARDGKQLSIAEAVHIVREVGKALSYAHSHQMIHRDVKPANVLMEVGGRIILTDFGIAKILTGPSYTVTGATIGTPAYMSPEQGLGRPGDHRSDIYALGVMLYQLATGQLPYEADTPLAVMLKHVNEPLPLPRTFKPDMPEGLERIILKAMAKNPDDRFQSADEMLAQLGDLDTAQLLVIPPASMAAGAAAHAATMAMPAGGKTSAGVAAVGGPPPITPADATRIAAGAGGAVPAGATVVGRLGATGVSGVAGATAAAGAAPLPVAQKKSSFPLWLVVALLVILLLLVIVGGAFAFTGGFGLIPRPSATATASATATLQPTSTSTVVVPSVTPPPVGTPTPDRIGTQVAALQGTALSNQETQAAFQASLASATPTNTPNLTATANACTYDYQLAGQQPEDGKTLVVGTKISKTLTIANTGLCAFKPGTILSETTVSTGIPAISVTVPAIAPQATQDIALNMLSRKSAGTVSHSFVMLDPAKTPIGQPITFTLKYIPGATPIPLATDTPVPPPATATSAAVATVQSFAPSYSSCHYSAGDYNCIVNVSINGGQAPYTIFLDGSQRFGDLPNPANFPIIGRRCLTRPFTIQVLDNFGSNLTKSFDFDPAQNPSIFPGGGCTLP